MRARGVRARELAMIARDVRVHGFARTCAPGARARLRVACACVRACSVRVRVCVRYARAHQRGACTLANVVARAHAIIHARRLGVFIFKAY